MVAQEVAVTAPERLERLALLSTSPGGAIASFRLDTLAELPDQERSNRALQLMDRRYDGIAPPANGQAIAERIATARFQAYEGGHAFFLQDPTVWAELVAFLSSGPS
jgi:pimeloyl-ACP methyl ester carboxylesterase